MEENGSPRKEIKMDRDRISSLPETVLHHVLSFLDMKEVMQTSLLSSRWRYLWISLPHLNFNDLMWKHNKAGLVNFVDRVLLFRSNSDLQKFSFDSVSYCYKDHIGKWITSVVRKHTEEVYMKLWSRESYELPQCLFASSVKVFTLKSAIVPIQLPKSMCSSANLKTLQLVSSKLPKGNSNGILVLTCPVLENLIIHDCDHRHLNALKISASQLKNLILKNQYPISNTGCKLQLLAPNLAPLEFYGYMYETSSLRNLSSLVTATIGPIVFVEGHAQCLSKMLQMLGHTRTLIMAINWFRNAPKSSYNLERLQTSFDNLRCLKLNTSRCYYIRIIVKYLLETCPHVDTLAWEINECGSGKKGEECGAQISSECKLHHLKSVKIHNLNGCEYELKFVELILRLGIVLENITITTTMARSTDKEKELVEFSKKLQNLFKASSSITILFLLKSKLD